MADEAPDQVMNQQESNPEQQLPGLVEERDDRNAEKREQYRQERLDRAQEEDNYLVSYFDTLEPDQKANFLRKAMTYFGMPIQREVTAQGRESGLDPLNPQPDGSNLREQPVGYRPQEQNQEVNPEALEETHA